MNNLDSDLLRTFVAVARAGSVTEGAALISRSQSATSLQIKRLEAVLGRPVFARHGRGVVLSDIGERLLPVALDVTARLDSALESLTQRPVAGKIRLGIPDDHGQEKLTRIIAEFSRQQPLVELDVTCALSAGFPEALRRGELDLAVYEVEAVSTGEELLSEDPTCWVTSATRDFTMMETLPVALFDHACWWRDAALASLQARGRPYRVVYSSQSVTGVLAAVEAGVAVGLLGRSSLHAGLAIAGQDYSFGPTASSKLVLVAREAKMTDAIRAMQISIRQAFSISGPSVPD